MLYNNKSDGSKPIAFCLAQYIVKNQPFYKTHLRANGFNKKQ